MTEPGDLEYCVRDHDGRIVVAWRPVGDLVAAVEEYSSASFSAGVVHRDGGEDWQAHDAAQHSVCALLGLEPAADAEDTKGSACNGR